MLRSTRRCLEWSLTSQAYFPRNKCEKRRQKCQGCTHVQCKTATKATVLSFLWSSTYDSNTLIRRKTPAIEITSWRHRFAKTWHLRIMTTPKSQPRVKDPRSATLLLTTVRMETAEKHRWLPRMLWCRSRQLAPTNWSTCSQIFYLQSIIDVCEKRCIII